MTNQKYRISDLAKDLDVKVKDITDILASNGGGAKNRLATLTPEEFNLVMNTITLNNQTTQFDKYIAGEAVIKIEPKKAPAPKKKSASAEAPKTEAAPAKEEAKTPSPAAAQRKPAAQDRAGAPSRQTGSRDDGRKAESRPRSSQPQAPVTRLNVSVQPPEPKTTSQVGHGSQRQNLIAAEAEAKSRLPQEARKRQQAQQQQPGGAQSRAQKQGRINGPQRGKGADTAATQPQPTRKETENSGTAPVSQQRTTTQQPAAPKSASHRQSSRATDRAARFENKPNFGATQNPQEPPEKAIATERRAG